MKYGYARASTDDQYYTPVDLLEKMLNCEQVTGAPIGAARGNA